MPRQVDVLQFKDVYSDEYLKTLDWIRNNKHLQESRKAQENPEYFSAVCRAAAAVVSLINNQDRVKLPDSKLYDAFRGVSTRSGDNRASFSIALADLQRITGLNGLPSQKGLREPGSTASFPYINVIWSRGDRSYDSLQGEEITEKNLITAFSSIMRDQVQNSIGDSAVWVRIGKESERQDLIQSVLATLRK